MRKPIPYKKQEPVNKKKIDKKKIALLIVCEIIIIILAVVFTAVISLLFNLTPFISAAISGIILVIFSAFIAREFLSK